MHTILLCHCLALSGFLEALVEDVMAPSSSSCTRWWRWLSPLPLCCLLVLIGTAWHQWEYAIYRRHIYTLCMCYSVRELPAEFCPGERQQELGNPCEQPPWGQELALGLAKVSCSRVELLPGLKGWGGPPAQARVFVPSSLGFKRRSLDILTPQHCEPCPEAGFRECASGQYPLTCTLTNCFGCVICHSLRTVG